MNTTTAAHTLALIAALRAGQQADEEGAFVKVSRQACEEAANMIEAASRAAEAVEPTDIRRAIRGLQVVRAVLGIDSPETRGWAPAVQQECRRAIDRALAALSASPQALQARD